MRILGIDPGYERLGIAVLEKNSSTKNAREEVVYSDCFKTSTKTPFPERLKLLGNEIQRIIETYKPDMFAIETLFFTTNQKTVMRVSEARGVILYQAAKHSLPIYEYTPLQIKIAISGYGRGDKKQITQMVKQLVICKKEIQHDDEYDAIAVALTCFASYKNEEILKNS